MGRSPWTAADAPSACWQAGQGAGEGAPHMDPPDAGYLSQVDSYTLVHRLDRVAGSRTRYFPELLT